MPAGVLIVAENPSASLNKVSELYDRIAFAGAGQVRRVRTTAQGGDPVRGHEGLRLRAGGRHCQIARQRLLPGDREHLQHGDQAARGGDPGPGGGRGGRRQRALPDRVRRKHRRREGLHQHRGPGGGAETVPEGQVRRGARPRGGPADGHARPGGGGQPEGEGCDPGGRGPGSGPAGAKVSAAPPGGAAGHGRMRAARRPGL